MRRKAETYLIDSWRTEIRRLWTIRVAVFWILISSILTIWSALTDVLPLWVYATLGVVMNLSLGVARLMKQPGTNADG